jgi:hypothetical protein
VTAARRLLVALILASTAMFVVGVLLERHQTKHETVETSAQREAEGGTASEAGESSDARAGNDSKGSAHVESSEKLLGVNPESTVLLAVAVVVSLLLAAAVWWRGGSPFVLGVVVVAMAAFAALDIREVVHQVNESRTGLAVLAAVVAALHGAAGILAGRTAVTARGSAPPLAPAA